MPYNAWSKADYIASSDYSVVYHHGCGKKWSWPDLRFSPVFEWLDWGKSRKCKSGG